MVMSLTDTTLEEFFSTLPAGSLDKAMLNNFRGINHRQIDSMLPMKKEMPGYTFFTRPQLNMTSDNLRNARKMTSLLTDNMTSIQRHIRTLLDPRLMSGMEFAFAQFPPMPCPLTDNHQAFIPFLTNNCLSSSGWPSISVPTFSSKAGLYNESYVMVDGRVIEDGTYDVTCNFRNVKGDPTLYLFYVWALYMSMVFEGTLIPYFDYITKNWVDYNTRIYRITMDHQLKHVQKISCARVAIPVGVDIGDAFNYSKGKPFTEANSEVPITFKCMGFDVFDDIVIREFNTVVGIFHKSMASDANREAYMVKIPHDLLPMFHSQGYPRINMDTTELEWWIEPEIYKYTLERAALSFSTSFTSKDRVLEALRPMTDDLSGFDF